MTDVYIKIANPTVKEGSSFTVTAYFRNGDASEVPTTSQYRVDCLKTGKELQDWTDLTPAASNNITMTATFNAIQDDCNRVEKKQLTVQANQGTSTQTRDAIVWNVENNGAITS